MPILIEPTTQQFKVIPPINGLWDGLDPAQDDQIFRPTYSPDLENIRVSRGLWETRYGKSLWRTLQPDFSADFTSANSEYLESADNAALSVADIDFWVSAWVYLDAVTGTQTVLSKGNLNSYSGAAYSLEISSTGVASFIVGNGVGSFGQASTPISTITAGSWIFLFGWHDAVSNTVNIKVNNGTTYSAAYSAGGFDDTQVFAIGRWTVFSGGYLDGGIDSVSIGKSPGAGIASLATTISTSLYNSGSGKTYADTLSAERTAWGMVAWWDLDETSGSRADSFGANTLTDNNTVLRRSGKAVSTGVVQFLNTAYKSDASRFRLVARGGVLYDWDEGDNGGTADTAFSAVSGGGSFHATNRFQGVQLGSYFYITDRSGTLKRYYIHASSTVSAVTQPAKPNSTPTFQVRYYSVLERWDGITAWTASNAAVLNIYSSSANDPAPGPPRSAEIRVLTGAAPTNTVSYNSVPVSNFSRTIAFYFKTKVGRGNLVQFQAGGEAADPTSITLVTPRQDTWYPIFMDVGLAETIRVLRFKHLNASSNPPKSLYAGPIYFPGKLQGLYYYKTSYYNSTTGGESSLNDNLSAKADVATIGASFDTTGTSLSAFRKCVALSQAYSSESGVDYIRVYRSGGVPELTTDERGRQIYFYIGQFKNVQTTLSGTASVGASTLSVTSATNMAIGDWLVIDRGTAEKTEYRRITNVSGTTITIDELTSIEHLAGDSINIAFMDNVANEEVDSTQIIAQERDDPPSGIHWLDKYDGRLWAFRYVDHPAGIAVSNRSTPERPLDYHVFPDGVDPLTRQDILQGWRFDLGGTSAGEEIVWGGFFNQRPTVLTKTGVWQILALSQAEFGASSVVKVNDRFGCVAGETVQILNGVLYWVTDGPRVVRWDGQGPPQIISHLRINKRLEAAPKAYWPLWHAGIHAKRDGNYYCLSYVKTLTQAYTDLVVDSVLNNKLTSVARPFVATDTGMQLTITGGTGFTTGTYTVNSVSSGAAIFTRAVGTTGSTGGTGNLHSGPSESLQYNADNDHWEPIVYYNSSGGRRGLSLLHTPMLGDDQRPQYAMATDGTIYQLDDTSVNTDAGSAITIRWASKRVPLPAVCNLQRFFVRLAGVSADSVTMTAKTGGSEYLDVSQAYTLNLAQASAYDFELRQPTHFNLKGRWAEFTLTGTVSNRPAIRELDFQATLIRTDYVKQS